MSVRVEVSVNGHEVGWMEIVQQGPVDEDEARNPGGLRYYRYRYHDKTRSATNSGEAVRHRRSDGVWDLVRRVLTHDDRMVAESERVQAEKPSLAMVEEVSKELSHG